MTESIEQPNPDGTERATDLVKDEGGLPDDNRFADLVETMRDEGQSWNEIYEEIFAVCDLVDKAALEEGWEIVPEWKVAVVVHDPESTSGERYEYYERMGETADEAEEMVSHKGIRVESEKTEKVGYAKVS